MTARTVQLTTEELGLLKKVFKDEAEVLVFGSRVNGKARKFSDVDLCIRRKRQVPIAELAQFRELLQESAFPYIVDVIDYTALSPEFKAIIDQTGVSLTSL